MKHLLSLAFACFFAGQASAQTMTEIDIDDVPKIKRQLENPALLYPNGGLNSDRKLGIDLAYYTEFTARYGHNIFRTSNEYTTLAVETDFGTKVHRVTLESDVFEDTYPLIADLNNDGQAEIITTQSSLTEGGSIAVYGLRDGELKKIAQTPYIGTRNRWMNVAGIADFNGDGLMEIALVDRPHIRGELEFWTYTANEKFELRLSSLGFSNHFIGSNAQRLRHVIKRKDKTPLLLLPSTSRRQLQMVDASGNDIKVIASAELPSPIAENFSAAMGDGFDIVGVLLADGTMKAFRITH